MIENIRYEGFHSVFPEKKSGIEMGFHGPSS